MKILGIDYGRSKIGIALSEERLAFPLVVLRVSSLTETIKKIIKIANEENVDKIVVGISEQNMLREQRKFVQELGKVAGGKVLSWDETLSTKEAQRLSRQAHLPRKKRKELEDAFAAAVMLQSYLDAHGNSDSAK